MSTEKIPLRKDVPAEHKWDLTRLYKSESDWEADLKKIPEFTEKMVAFKGRLGESSNTLLAALKADDELGLLVEKVYHYASLMNEADQSEIPLHRLGMLVRKGQQTVHARLERKTKLLQKTPSFRGQVSVDIILAWKSPKIYGQIENKFRFPPRFFAEIEKGPTQAWGPFGWLLFRWKRLLSPPPACSAP